MATTTVPWRARTRTPIDIGRDFEWPIHVSGREEERFDEGARRFRDALAPVWRCADILRKVTPSLRTARLLLQPLQQAAPRVQAQIEAGTTIAWSLLPFGADVVIGMMGLHQIDRVAACAQIAYELDGEWAGKALALEAAQRILEFARDELGLRRIEAHIGPENSRSIRLVERLGFVRESEREDTIVYATPPQKDS